MAGAGRGDNAGVPARTTPCENVPMGPWAGDSLPVPTARTRAGCRQPMALGISHIRPCPRAPWLNSFSIPSSRLERALTRSARRNARISSRTRHPPDFQHARTIDHLVRNFPPRLDGGNKSPRRRSATADDAGPTWISLVNWNPFQGIDNRRGRTPLLEVLDALSGHQRRKVRPVGSRPNLFQFSAGTAISHAVRFSTSGVTSLFGANGAPAAAPAAHAHPRRRLSATGCGPTPKRSQIFWGPAISNRPPAGGLRMRAGRAAPSK